MRKMYHPDTGWEPYKPWSAERRRAASIAAKRRLALKKRTRLEAELKEVEALLAQLSLG
jgi:hypothetical protein